MRAHEAGIHSWIDWLLIGRREVALGRVHCERIFRHREIPDPVTREQRSIAYHITSSIARTDRIMTGGSNRDIPRVVCNEAVLCRRDECAHCIQPFVRV